MMTVAFYSAKGYEKPFFEHAAADSGVTFRFIEATLNVDTAVLAQDCLAACIFVNDKADGNALIKLHQLGVKFLALRCAGYNQVDLEMARSLGMLVARVPAYSPYAVAEHAIALMLSLNRHIHKAHNRVREGNFALDGLLGFDMHGKTAGLIGLGKIGLATARILKGLGCKVIAYDVMDHPEAHEIGVQYVSLDQVLETADIVSLHCPLTPETHHLINDQTIGRLKRGMMLINTSRGALIDTQAVIKGLKSGQIGYLGLDVYEEEGDLFFRDLSEQVIQDDVFMRLSTFPNVLITGHQAFFTRNALTNIADTTMANLRAYMYGEPIVNAV